MTSDSHRRALTRWDTVAVESLPTGWRNAFSDVGAGEGAIVYGPCPALLLQEARETVRGSAVEKHRPPYQTRVVFADFSTDNAELCPADDASNYIRTLAPGEADIG